jgi:hypothetical protein
MKVSQEPASFAAYIGSLCQTKKKSTEIKEETFKKNLKTVGVPVNESTRFCCSLVVFEKAIVSTQRPMDEWFVQTWVLFAKDSPNTFVKSANRELSANTIASACPDAFLFLKK